MQNCRPMRRTGAVSEGSGPFFRCSVHVRLVMAEVWRVPLIQAAAGSCGSRFQWHPS